MGRSWLALASMAAACVGCSSEPRVVLSCAQDQDFATGILADFTRDGGPRVDAKFDTEANKSVGLVEELRREKDRPRTDVHWNNEILGTIRLQREGILEPYRSPTAEPYPDWTRPADHAWQAFAARARVLIVNTERVPEADRPRGLFDLLDPKWRGRVAMAKPQFGTTATHAACLFEALGGDEAKRFYRGLKGNDVNVVAGNKQVAESVGSGRFDVGMTDSDDALIEVRAGRPVAIVFPDADGDPERPGLGVLYIPNTLALIKGGPNPDAGKRLIDHLLSAEVEKRLAEGGGYQIPLNPNVEADLPAELKTPSRIGRVMGVDFGEAADRWDEAQEFLRAEFAGG